MGNNPPFKEVAKNTTAFKIIKFFVTSGNFSYHNMFIYLKKPFDSSSSVKVIKVLSPFGAKLGCSQAKS